MVLVLVIVVFIGCIVAGFKISRGEGIILKFLMVGLMSLLGLIISVFLFGIVAISAETFAEMEEIEYTVTEIEAPGYGTRTDTHIQSYPTTNGGVVAVPRSKTSNTIQYYYSHTGEYVERKTDDVSIFLREGGESEEHKIKSKLADGSFWNIIIPDYVTTEYIIYLKK